MPRRTEAAAWAALPAAAMLALAWGYGFGGSAEPGILDRAGHAVLWTVPAAKVLSTLASAAAIGTLVLALFALPHHGPAYTAALTLAGRSAAVWAGAAALHTYASFLLIANTPPSAALTEAFVAYATRVDAGRAGTVTVLLAAAVACLCVWFRSPRMLPWTVTAAAAGLFPLILKSHAAGGSGHADTTVALFLHAIGAAIWLGGLLALVVLRTKLPAAHLGAVAYRYSTLALISFTSLAVSGMLAALARIDSPDDLTGPYGGIILAKAAVFVVLGCFGVLHRWWSLGRIERHPDSGGRHFAALAAVELAILGAASGLAVALARTEPPQTAAGGAETPLPDPGLLAYLSESAPDPFWILACSFAVAMYLAGVRRLHAAGRPWPASRTMLWLAGVAVLAAVTNGGLHAYQGYLFSAHVATQMMLTAVVPLLIVPAAPLTLIRLAARARTDGSAGAREFVERCLDPILAALRRDPFLAVAILVVSLFLVYYTPLLEWAAAGQAGYTAMTLLALATGGSATAALTGYGVSGTISPARRRLAALAGLGAAYAFCGWTLLERAPALEMPWYTSVGRPWGASPAAAAEAGGPLMWFLAALALLACTAMIIHAAAHRLGPEPASSRESTEGPGQDEPRNDSNRGRYVFPSEPFH